jgi:hypothetical protein
MLPLHEGVQQAMVERKQRNVENLRQEADQEMNGDVVSAARRRVVKAGIASMSLILTLKSKPVFANDPCGKSMTYSAANSHGILDDPGCKNLKPY